MATEKPEFAFLNENLARKLNLAFLCIHIFFLAAFAYLDATIMVIVNIFSITTYILQFRIIKKNLITFLLVSYMEILGHMLLAAICMSWSFGFQLYCFAVIPIAYYSFYLSKKTNTKIIHPFPLVLIDIMCFIFTTLYAVFGTSVYGNMGQVVETTFFIINTCLVFAFIIVYLSLFSRMCLKVELILQHSAEYDALTGLANRYRINSVFEQLCDPHSHMHSEFSIAIFDIDNFKSVNDTYGHNIGDKVLQNVADILKSSENSGIYACRWGGEEFLVIIAGDNSLTTAKKALEQIRIKVADSVVYDSKKAIKITVSCGVSLHREHDSILTTINRADSYLYEAKATGKNKVISHD